MNLKSDRDRYKKIKIKIFQIKTRPTFNKEKEQDIRGPKFIFRLRFVDAQNKNDKFIYYSEIIKTINVTMLQIKTT